MQRKPGFPVANCAIKMPENGNTPTSELHCDDDLEQQQRRQQLINFGHSQWGFNNWSWSVTKQELDFVDFANGKYCAGVVAYVSIIVKSIDIHRDNIGYATSLAANKGFAIYKSRKSAVTNALRETLLSFGGTVASELMESLEARVELAPEPAPEPVPPKPEPKASPPARMPRKEPEMNARVAHGTPLVANPPPVAKAHPMPAALAPPRVAPPPAPPACRPPAPHLPPAPPAAPPPLRPNSNEVLPLASDASEEARAERKRRQRQAQEEFRQRQIMKQKSDLDEKQDLHKSSNSFDNLLMAIPTQDIVIEETGTSTVDRGAKRNSPIQDGNSAKRRASIINKLDIVQAD